jgi:hypothetical protein
VATTPVFARIRDRGETAVVKGAEGGQGFDGLDRRRTASCSAGAEGRRERRYQDWRRTADCSADADKRHKGRHIEVDRIRDKLLWET